jgi:broad specificity phosphatase PhoE
MNVTTLILVKHALPVIDASKPAKEWQLSAKGELQAEALAEHLRTFAPLRMIASPEPKAARTAELVAERLHVGVHVVDDLREFDRPRLPLLSKEDHARANAEIFANPNQRVLGNESARDALARFAAALDAELERSQTPTLVAITHGTVTSLFAGAHNTIDAFALWQQLVCPAYVVLNVPTFSLREVVADAGAPR